jgi:hypothetical protein
MQVITSMSLPLFSDHLMATSIAWEKSSFPKSLFGQYFPSPEHIRQGFLLHSHFEIYLHQSTIAR